MALEEVLLSVGKNAPGIGTQKKIQMITSASESLQFTNDTSTNRHNTRARLENSRGRPYTSTEKQNLQHSQSDFESRPKTETRKQKPKRRGGTPH
ncbi:hypothetical protein C8Q79DRAFT_993118 [Trametes meyenii]|nr:hypothetical protein C8Q79DRAFT_993118 [Trametes meyenii]